MSNENTLKSLGTLLDPNKLPPRDAVHIAVVPCIAAKALLSGDPVKLNSEGKAVDTIPSDSIGVVDPFLHFFPISVGKAFWLYLNPGSITSLTHHWTHPAFPAEDKVEKAGVLPGKYLNEINASHEWVRDYAEDLGISYETLMSGADSWLADKSGWNRLNCGEVLEGEYTSSAFWEHYEIIRGVNVPEKKKTNFFTCSC